MINFIITHIYSIEWISYGIIKNKFNKQIFIIIIFYNNTHIINKILFYGLIKNKFNKQIFTIIIFIMDSLMINKMKYYGLIKNKFNKTNIHNDKFYNNTHIFNRMN